MPNVLPSVKNVFCVMSSCPTTSNTPAVATVGIIISERKYEMTSLVTHHFLFTTEVVTPIELDDHSGAALRGSLFDSVWRRFCTNKASPTCAACPLHAVCP